MAFDITDDSRLEILVDDGWRQWYIPKFRIEMTVSGDEVYLYWTDSERGTVGLRRLLVMDYNDVTFGYLTPSSASEVVTVINSYIISAWTDITSSTVSSVTDDGNGAVTVDNTDPLNPVIGFSAQVDGLTITGDGKTSTPLEAKFVTLGVQSSIVPHTGTAAETILYALLIPGGTIGNNDKLMVHAIFRKNSGSGGFTVRARLHTANAVAGTAIGNNVISTAGNTCRIMSEQWWQNDNNSSIGFPTGGGSFQSTWGANYVTTALDNTADIYVLITGQLATSGDTAELSSARVELYKY